MTKHAHPPLLARRWREFMLAAVLLVLSGAVLLVWLRIDAEAQRADRLGAEASRRGTAVTTLAEDVRVLREQVKAEGATPAAPDPSRAVKGLPDRVESVPGAPGRPGESGQPGRPGKDGRDGVDGRKGKDGADGSAGEDGADGTAGGPGPPGPAGPPGEDGKDGKDGADGRDGQTCPDGYSLQVPDYDPDALVCRKDSAPPPDEPEPSPSVLGLPVERRRS
ncbi:collagen-like protein [Streptomyces indicus]|uniref:Collagen triple helix repeat-containing protein n=1 Tax=Streptomyces indicus TaxID=417292 RepID=A0A1G9K067_9ACTN|nr:collagen-like protein [Streptomyces indicus]SDL43310.1 Collagen triple helix repeat-containing protein [Streptomyces indicus]